MICYAEEILIRELYKIVLSLSGLVARKEMEIKVTILYRTKPKMLINI
jgi:hypothetical protein